MLAPLILVAFVAGWCLISLLISAMGWMGLAARYRTRAPATGRIYAVQSGDIGARYTGVLIFGIQPDGLRMSVLLPFRVGHPPLLVPWSDIDLVEDKKTMFGTLFVFRIGKPYGTTVKVGREVGRAIAAAIT